MAEGLTSETVKKAVDECNEAMQKIDEQIDGGLDALDVVSELKSIAGELHQSWETDNGNKTMFELFKVFDSLDTNLNNFIKSANHIKSDKYTFTKDSKTEYDWS